MGLKDAKPRPNCDTRTTIICSQLVFKDPSFSFMNAELSKSIEKEDNHSRTQIKEYFNIYGAHGHVATAPSSSYSVFGQIAIF